MAPRAPREHQDQTESPVLWEQVERRENLESLDYLDTLVDKAPRAPTDSLDSQGRMERREEGESPAKQDREGSAAQRVHVVGVVLEDQPESQVQRALQAMMEQGVHQERGDLKDHRDPSASPDLKDQTDRQEKMGCPVTPDREERRASMERRDLRDLEGWLDLRARLERQDLAESEDTQALQVHLVSKVCLDLLEKRAERVIQVLRVVVARQDLPASGASRGPEVFQEPWVQVA